MLQSTDWGSHVEEPGEFKNETKEADGAMFEIVYNFGVQKIGSITGGIIVYLSFGSDA
jgi:hypothetical protein